MSPIAVILPAAGASTRFGGLEKKPFVTLAGRPVWQRSAELFWSRREVVAVRVVVSPEDESSFRERYRHVLAFLDVDAKIIPGGSERFESVANALATIPESVELVAIHDAVRPLCTSTLIDAVFEAAHEHGAAMLAVPVVDTLKKVNPDHVVTGTVDRAGVWAAQTPQVFRRDWLVEAYAQRSNLNVPITDDAQLLEACGRVVRVVPGAAQNLKITTRGDLELAEALLANRAKSSPVASPSRAFGDEAEW